jgi:hypothetical protein
MAEIQKCLHCTVRDAVVDWAEAHAERLNGVPSYDVAEIVASLSEVMAEHIEMLDDRGKRRRALRFAHEALDAGVKAVRTGERQLINTPTEH